jgi:hypothetical protein
MDAPCRRGHLKSDDPALPQIAFTEAAGAMVAAVLHLVRLLGAEFISRRAIVL